YNPDTEITVTSGATQAIFTAIAAVINPGDEVIIFEPAYDCYAPAVKMFGGLVKPYEMLPPDYSIDWEMVKKLFSANTRMIIINSPHNPTGSIFTENDIRELIRLTKGTDIIILSDEVYEHIIFDGQQHYSLSMYPELKERSFIVASFGKLLHATGWKIGYCLGPAKLMAEFRKVHQFNVFCSNHPLQESIAQYLQDEHHYIGLPSFFQKKRDLFRELIAPGRFKLLPCNGSYFQCLSYESISNEKDTEFARMLTTDFGVAGIPVSAFYQKGKDHHIIRFCFAKMDDTIEQAAKKLLLV
ncbi:MAG: aminotransferase class I/II-fold pyridoxal phosphate-dependent enzyme, partial [Pedobacter sp.]